jgi:prevent-host-death family protein
MGVISIGIYEAKNKFSELLERVEAGETIAVTRHGKQVALLTPVKRSAMSAEKAVAMLHKTRKGCRLGGVTVKQLRDEGRP